MKMSDKTSNNCVYIRASDHSSVIQNNTKYTIASTYVTLGLRFDAATDAAAAVVVDAAAVAVAAPAAVVDAVDLLSTVVAEV